MLWCWPHNVFFSCPVLPLLLSVVIFPLYCLPFDWPSASSLGVLQAVPHLSYLSEVGTPVHLKLSKSLPSQVSPVSYIIKSFFVWLQSLPNLAPVCFFIWISPHFPPSVLCIAPFLAIHQLLNTPLFWFCAFVPTTPWTLWLSPYWSAFPSFQTHRKY